MCLIAYIKDKENPDFSDANFRTSWSKNPDGLGMMWTAGDKVETFHSLDMEESLVKYNELKGKVDHLSIHFRWGTSGTKNIENTHPFKILDLEEDGVDMYMMHNGVISVRETDKTMCDTWHFANNYIKPLIKKDFHLLFTPEMTDLIENKIGGSKLLFLYNSPKWCGTHIIHENKGKWLNHKGVWLSNEYSIYNWEEVRRPYHNSFWGKKEEVKKPAVTYKSTWPFVVLPPEDKEYVPEERLFQSLPTGSRTTHGNLSVYDDGRAFQWNRRYGGWEQLEDEYNAADGSKKEIKPVEQEVKTDEEVEKDEGKKSVGFSQPFLIPPTNIKGYYKRLMKFMELLAYVENEGQLMQIIKSRKHHRALCHFIMEIIYMDDGGTLNTLYDFLQDAEAGIFDEVNIVGVN